MNLTSCGTGNGYAAAFVVWSTGYLRSAPVTLFTSVIESKGRSTASCASASGPDMKQNALPSLRLT